MDNRKYKSISKQLTLYVLFGLGILFIFATLITFYVNKKISYEQFLSKNEIIINELQGVFVQPLWQVDLIELESIAKSFTEDPSIVSLDVFNESTDLLYSYKIENEVRLPFQEENKMLKFNIYYEGDVIGLVKINFSQKPYLKEIYTMIFVNIILLFFVLIFTSLIIIIVFKRVFKNPTDILIESAAEYSKGNYSHTINNNTVEFIPLVDTFNTMANKIYNQIKELNENQDNLEKKVKSRTNQLLREKQFINSIMNSTNQLIITLDQNVINSVNESFLNFFEIESEDEFFRLNKDNFEGSKYKESLINLTSLITYEKMFKELYEKKFYKIPILDDIFSINTDNFSFEGKRIKTIALSNITELEKVRHEVEEMNRLTKESIEYSSMIQRSIIPPISYFDNFFKEYVLMWEPKDIVGGDIYFFEKLRNEDEYLFMFIDCTGHGVPGSLVTMLVKAVEKQVITSLRNKKGDINTSSVLKEFNREMKILLQHNEIEGVANVGFDGAILYINKKERLIKYSGARMPLYYTQNTELKQLKPDKYSVGYVDSDANYKYTETELIVEDDMSFYLFTDGLPDQIGGAKGFPFGRKKLEKIIEENSHMSMEKQKEIIINTVRDYQGDEEQNDDISFIGFKIDNSTEGEDSYHI